MKSRTAIFYLLALPLAATTLAAMGCGGGDRASTIDGTNAALTPSGTAMPSPSTQAQVTITQDELASALLTINEMPTGWTTRQPDEEDTREDLCGFESSDVAPPITELSADFQQSETGPFLSQILQLHQAGNAKVVGDAFLEMTRSCPEWTVTEDDGSQTTWRLTALSFPKLGDQTVAVRLTSSESTLLGVAEIDYVVVRRGEVINRIAYLELGFAGIDSAHTDQFARLADNRVKALD